MKVKYDFITNNNSASFIMNILCKLGFHNWYYIESITKEQLGGNIYHQWEYDKKYNTELEFPPYPPYPPPPQIKKQNIGGSKEYHKKVCLKCGKKIDNITPLKEKLEKEIKEKNRTLDEIKKKAMMLYNK